MVEGVQQGLVLLGTFFITTPSETLMVKLCGFTNTAIATGVAATNATN